MLRIAHRGASAYEAENSMAAFKRAVTIGVDYIEADVQITLDDVPIIRHDPLLDRTTNVSGYINELTFEEINQRAILSNNERIPSLNEVCEFVARQQHVKLYVDLKVFGKEEIVHKILSTWLPVEKYIIGAFHAGVILAVKKINPAIKTVLILEGNLVNIEKEVIESKCDIVALGFDAIDENEVRKIKNIPRQVFTWTVNDVREIARARRIGVDGIISNNPDLI